MDKCPHEQSIRALETRDGEIVEWMRRLETKLDGITSIMVEVKDLEGKNSSNKEALDRAFKEVEEVKGRLKNLEDAYNQSKGAAGMLKYLIPALWAVLGSIGTYLATVGVHIH